jgi:hypothetical protein
MLTIIIDTNWQANKKAPQLAALKTYYQTKTN